MTKRETMGLSYLEEAEDRIGRLKFAIRQTRLTQPDNQDAYDKVLREIMHIWRVVKFAEGKLSKIERREGK